MDIKRGQIKRALLREVKEHVAAFKEPIPLRILSAKFSKQMKPYGGIRVILDELECDGSLVVTRTITGALYVDVPKLRLINIA